ncbi:glyceraldehyde-3-phosphate dehydrogenase 1 [Pseudohyphozyma bogoriensis]|nr:glyceraldehyde-3-phosphate dehydrogenase 1 [Pseudohyphozyma bogoriensis]
MPLIYPDEDPSFGGPSFGRSGNAPAPFLGLGGAGDDDGPTGPSGPPRIRMIVIKPGSSEACTPRLSTNLANDAVVGNPVEEEASRTLTLLRHVKFQKEILKIQKLLVTLKVHNKVIKVVVRRVEANIVNIDATICVSIHVPSLPKRSDIMGLQDDGILKHDWTPDEKQPGVVTFNVKIKEKKVKVVFTKMELSAGSDDEGDDEQY